MLTGATRTFRTRMDAVHPMLHHHRVFGTPVLPGLAYIDVLYQLVKNHLPLVLDSMTTHLSIDHDGTNDTFFDDKY